MFNILKYNYNKLYLQAQIDVQLSQVYRKVHKYLIPNKQIFKNVFD